jgi:Cys-tRNA(Pro)/Cys-tRNA(Cys) deacylase
MKKSFPTYFDASVEGLEKITVSAGVRGAQLLVNASELIKYLDAKTADVTAQN